MSSGATVKVNLPRVLGDPALRGRTGIRIDGNERDRGRSPLAIIARSALFAENAKEASSNASALPPSSPFAPPPPSSRRYIYHGLINLLPELARLRFDSADSEISPYFSAGVSSLDKHCFPNALFLICESWGSYCAALKLKHKSRLSVAFV